MWFSEKPWAHGKRNTFGALVTELFKAFDCLLHNLLPNYHQRVLNITQQNP